MKACITEEIKNIATESINKHGYVSVAEFINNELDGKRVPKTQELFNQSYEKSSTFNNQMIVKDLISNKISIISNNGTVFINKGKNISNSTLVKYFSLPFLQLIQEDNPEFFSKLLNDVNHHKDIFPILNTYTSNLEGLSKDLQTIANAIELAGNKRLDPRTGKILSQVETNFKNRLKYLTDNTNKLLSGNFDISNLDVNKNWTVESFTDLLLLYKGQFGFKTNLMTSQVLDITPETDFTEESLISLDNDFKTQPEVKFIDETENNTQENKDNSGLEDFDFDDPFGGEVLFRTIIDVPVTPVNNDEMSWFNEVLNPNRDRLIMSNMINSTAWGKWSTAGITLYANAQEGTLYHEGWHEFSQMYLTKGQRESLYNEALNGLKKQDKDYYNNLNDHDKQLFLEEFIAEDFRSYMQTDKSKLIVKNRSIFQRIKNFLKNLFGNITIEKAYNDLKNNNLSKYKQRFDSYFGTLNRNAYVFDNLNDNSDKIVQSFFDHISIMHSQYATIQNIDYKDTAKLKEFNLNVFKAVYADLKRKLSTIEDTNSLAFQTLNILVNGKLDFNGKETSVYSLLINDYINEQNIKIERTEDIISDFIDEDGNINSDTKDESEKSRNMYDDDNNTDTLSSSSKELRAMFENLPSLQLNSDTGKYERVYNEYGFIEKADGIYVFKTLLNELNGISNIEEVYSKLDELKKSLPEIEAIINHLKYTPQNDSSMGLYRNLRETDFLKTFNRAYVPRMIFLANPKSGTIRMIKAQNKAYDQIIEDWKANFENSIYAKKGVNGVKLDSKKLLEDFPFYSLQLLGRPSAEERIKKYNNRLSFLEALGIKLSENTIKSSEVQNILNNTHEEGKFDIILDFHNWIRTMIANKNPIENVIEDMRAYRTFATIKGDYIVDRRKDLQRLIDIEAIHSSDYFEPSIYNAADKTEYEYQLHNYLTVLSNTLNNPKYKTLNEIFELPEYEYLNPNKNPILHGSLIINKMFENIDGVWNRKIVNGNPITYSLISYNGLNIIQNEDVKENGVVTTKMNPVDKMLMDINNVINYGVTENIRTGDKASAFAFLLSNWDKNSAGRKLSAPLTLEEASDITLSNVNLQYDDGGKFMRDLIIAESKRIKFALNTPELKTKQFSKAATKFNYFDAILSKNSKQDLLDIINRFELEQLEEVITAELLNSNIGTNISKEIKEYFTERADKIKQYLLDNGLNVLVERQLLDKIFGNIKFVNGKKLNLDQIINSYLTLSTMLNIENTRMFYGDLAFYKDPFKRFSGFTATGVLARTDDSMLKFLNNHPNTTRQSRQYAMDNNIIDMNFTRTNELNTAVFDDVLNVSKYYEDIKSNLIDIKVREGMTKSEAEKYVNDLDVLEAYRGSLNEDGSYSGYTEPDAFAVSTLEFYREAALRTKTWNSKQENVYEKILNNEPISLEEMALFPPRKDQYTGGIKNPYGLHIPAMHKYSIVPLIPQAIKGTPYEKLNNRMLRQSIGYTTFISGSKIETLLPESNKLQKFYNGEDFNDTEIHTNTIFWNYIKNQVEIAPKMKEENTFGTQYRKLLFQDKFNDGIPIDFKGDKSTWESLSEKEQLEKSYVKTLYKNYNDLLSGVTNAEKNAIEKDLGLRTLENGNIEVGNWIYLRDLIKAEVYRRDLPNSVLNSFKVSKKGNKEVATLEVDNLEGAKNKQIVEQLLFVIVNNRLVSQKLFGDALIQGAVTGFEKLKDKINFSDKGYSKDLAFYRIDKKTNKVLPMQVKISFDLNKHLDILKLKFNNERLLNEGQPIEAGIAKLNEILNIARVNEESNEAKWVESNKKFFQLVGYRIPTQGLNSIESMQVVEFLPTVMAGTIIVPSEIVVSAGSDFDIDKLNVFQYKTTFNENKDQLEIIRSNKDIRNKNAFSNRLLDLAIELLSLESTYEGLVTPNSTNIIKDQIADKIKVEVNKRTSEFNSSKSPTMVIDPLNILEQFNAFLAGKETLGIAALGNTFTQLYQSVGAYLNWEFTPIGKDKAKPVKYILKHSIKNINGREYISYGNTYDVDNKIKKSELFSQFINAYVDIAKEPFIFYMNAGKKLAPVIFHMINMGTPIKDIAYFVNQPIIRDYIKKLDVKDSKLIKSALQISNDNLFDFTYKTTVLDELVSSYVKNSGKQDEIGNYQNAVDYFDNLFFNKKNGNNSKTRFMEISSDKLIEDMSLPLTTINTDTRKEGFLRQLLYLVQLEELLSQAGSIRDTQGTLNFDTKKTNGIIDLNQRIKNLDYFKSGKGIFPSEIYNRLMSTTPIASYNQYNFLNNLIGPLFPLSSNKTITDLLEEVKNGVKEAGTFNVRMSEKIDKAFYNQMISFIIQNGIFNDGKFINNIFDKYTPMMSGANNIGIRLNELKELFEQNLPNSKEARFLNNFTKKETRKNNLVFINYSGDKLTGNLINSYEQIFRDLLEFTHENQEFASKVRTFFNDLMYISLLQNGIAKTGTTFNELIPDEKYTEIVGSLIQNFIKDTKDLTTLSDNTYKGFRHAFLNLFRSNNPVYRPPLKELDGNTFNNYPNKGFKSFKEYKLNYSGGKFLLKNTIVQGSNTFIELDPNYSDDLLGGDVIGTEIPSKNALILDNDPKLSEYYNKSARVNKEAFDVNGKRIEHINSAYLTNDELFSEGKKTALSLPLNVLKKNINGVQTDYIKINNIDFHVGDAIFLGHTFDKYRIKSITPLFNIISNIDLVKQAAAKEYVYTWYFTNKNNKESYKSFDKHGNIYGSQIEFERIYEQIDNDFEYLNAYIEAVPGELNNIKLGNKTQITVELNRNIEIGDTLVVRDSNQRNANTLMVEVSSIQEVNLNTLFSNDEEWKRYLSNEAHSNLSPDKERAAKSYRARLSNINNGNVLVLSIKNINTDGQELNRTTENIEINNENSLESSKDIRIINIGSTEYELRSDNKYYLNNKEVTDSIVINELDVNKAYTDGNLYISKGSDNTQYYIINNRVINADGMFKNIEANITDLEKDLIINSATLYKKNC